MCGKMVPQAWRLHKLVKVTQKLLVIRVSNGRFHGFTIDSHLYTVTKMGYRPPERIHITYTDIIIVQKVDGEPCA